jgi:transposase
MKTAPEIPSDSLTELRHENTLLLYQTATLSQAISSLEQEQDRLGQTISSLEQEQDRLGHENQQLTQEKDRLGHENQQLEQEKDQLGQKNQQLAQDNELLGFRLAQLERMLFGSKRERFIPQEHPAQLSLDFDVAEAVIDAQIQEDKQRISYERKKVRKPHPGRGILPSHLDVNEIIIAPKEDVSDMVCIGREVTDELGYTPARLFINRYIRYKYMSKEDDQFTQRQVIADLERPMPKCIASPELIANILVDKYVYHIPIYRQLQKFTHVGIHINASTADSWLALVAPHVRPIYPVLKTYVLSSGYLQADESPIKVQDSNKPGATHQGYMWVYRDPLKQAVFFDYHKGRGQEAPQKYLTQYKGYLQTDAYGAYDQFGKNPDIIQLGCWAHARRYFEKALDNDRQRASTVLQMIQLLYIHERHARENLFTPQERHAHRLEKSLPILNQIGTYISQHRMSVLPKSPIAKAFEYCTAIWDRLMNYLKDGNLEIDNNGIENAIRPLALGRKNYLFAGSHDAAQNIAMYYSLFETCKMHSINPYKWITYIINHINQTKTSQLKNLLPQFIDKNLLD